MASVEAHQSSVKLAQFVQEIMQQARDASVGVKRAALQQYVDRIASSAENETSINGNDSTNNNRAMQLTQVGGGGQSSCLPPRRRLSGTGSMATACCASR